LKEMRERERERERGREGERERESSSGWMVRWMNGWIICSISHSELLDD